MKKSFQAPNDSRRSALGGSRSILTESEGFVKLPPQNCSHEVLSDSISSENGEVLSSRLSLNASQNFEKNWKAYMGTLIDSSQMLCSQTDISKQQLCNLLHRQIDICNKIFLIVSMSPPGKFQDIIKCVTDNTRLDYQKTQRIVTEGALRRNHSDYLSNQKDSKTAGFLTGVELPRRRGQPGLANPFEGDSSQNGMLLNDLLPAHSLNSYKQIGSIDYKLIDENSNDKAMFGSQKIEMSNDWQNGSCYKKQPLELDGQMKKFISSQNDGDQSFAWAEYQKNSANSMNPIANYFEFKEPEKEGGGLEDYRKFNSNESLTAILNRPFKE